MNVLYTIHLNEINHEVGFNNKTFRKGVPKSYIYFIFLKQCLV